jgi:hypothetical protein
MPFKPGEPRPEHAGRKAGTPNKKTNSLFERLESYGVEPIKEIVNLLPELNPKERADVFRDLLAYIYPRRKAVELAIEDGTTKRPERMTKEEHLKTIFFARRGLHPMESLEASMKIAEKSAADYVLKSQDADGSVETRTEET